MKNLFKKLGIKFTRSAVASMMHCYGSGTYFAKNIPWYKYPFFSANDFNISLETPTEFSVRIATNKNAYLLWAVYDSDSYMAVFNNRSQVTAYHANPNLPINPNHSPTP